MNQKPAKAELEKIIQEMDRDKRNFAETVLRSEERYRTIFEYTGNATILIAEDTTILLANSNFAQLTGYKREEIEGKMSWTVFIVPEDLAGMKQYHFQRRESKDSVPNSYEFRLRSRTGEIRMIFLTVALVPGTKESVASCMDITDREQSMEALIQSEERFRDMASLLPETVFETDMSGRLTFVNETSFERFGYTGEDFAKGLNFMDVIAPQEHERALANFRKIALGERLGLSEYLVKTKDGTTFPAMIHSTRIFKGGQTVGSRGFLVDISEKKVMEEQLLRAQKMEAIGTLAGGIAHDFNNLLMGILGNLSMLLMHLDETHPFYERLKTMEEYVQRGSNLTRQLLGFARGGKYEVRTTHLGKFALRSADVFGRTKKDIAIHHKTTDDLWHVDVDRGQMDQVLLNLFVNAWQAMPSGGSLFIALENVELSASNVAAFNVRPGKFVKLTVTDTGIGMDEHTKSHIFEPFFSTKERGHGTGLGLASVYGIIKNHGGFIQVESEKGGGTSFIIHLPASEKKMETEWVKDNKLYKGRETILLIDDEDMMVDVGTQMLKGLGYKVLTATGGRQGIAVFESNQEQIDLVILDMIMPDLSGKETFEALVKLKPSIKALLSSGYSQDGQAKDIMDLGCQGFIQKPFTMTELSRKIRDILEKR
ncbi:MAG: PAS domain S-box protein [Smithella sp.]